MAENIVEKKSFVISFVRKQKLTKTISIPLAILLPTKVKSYVIYVIT